ncbi:MAG TPA: hypothetical protein DHU79_06590 [Clostridiales bacterium]|nr:hypothetical protein [Clostridiales bacterium]
MTKFKKIIPALCMLLISAVLMGTSTYAWFSMNTSVKATEMKVTAKSDAVFLQIINASDTFDATAQTSVKTNVAAKTVRPTNVYKTFNATNPTAFAGGSEFVFVSNYSKDPTDSTKAGEYTDVTADAKLLPNDENATKNVYTLISTYKIRLKPDTGAATAPGKLKVSGVAFHEDSATSGLQKAVSVLIVCGNFSVVYKQTETAGTFVATGDPALSADAFANTTGEEVKVYVFFDGDNAACTTNNIALDDTFSVDVTFNCNKD